MKSLPTWKLEQIYSSLTAKNLRNHFRLLNKNINRIVKLIKTPPQAQDKKVMYIKKYIACYNTCSDLLVTLYAFAYMHYTINTNNYDAVKCMNVLDKAKIPLIGSIIKFRNALVSDKQLFKAAFVLDPALKAYSFFLNEQLILQKHQMTQDEEERCP